MFRQSGVIPYRIEAGQLEILLITSSRRKRWVIPKGWVELSMTSADSAAKEAREEAGIVGTIDTPAIGFYTVRKLGIPLKVEVFPMRVETELDCWKEANFRERQWFSPAEAAKLVKKRQLKQMIQQWERSSAADS